MIEEPPRRRAGSLRYGLPGVLLVAALAAWGLQAWHDAEPEASSAPAGVLRRESASTPADERPLQPAALPDAAREIESLPDGSDEGLAAARRNFLVLEWWGVPPSHETPRLPCTVIVVDGEDRPVSGATIEMRSADMSGQHVTWLTDEHGQSTLTPQGSSSLLASLSGVGCSGLVRAWSRNKDQPRTVLLPLQPEVSLRGRVVTGDGQPCPNVSVFSYSATEHRKFPAEHPQPTFERRTDAQGRFSLDAHVADGFVVEAVRDELRSETVPITEELARRELVLVLPSQAPETGLRGIALNAQGEPMPGLGVMFWKEGIAHGNELVSARRHAAAADSPPWFTDTGLSDAINTINTIRTDESGAFHGSSVSRTKGWLTMAAGGPPIQTPQRVTAETSARQEPLVLRACAPAIIAGQLLDPQGKPLGNAIVWTVSHWPDDTPAAMAWAVPSDAAFGSASASVDVHGRFVLPGLHPDARFDIAFEGYDGRLTCRGVVPDVAAGNTSLRVVVGADRWLTGSIRATVTSALTGAVIESLKIRVRRPQVDEVSPALEDVTADLVSGVRRITALREGEACDVLVSAKGFGSAVVRDVVATSAGTPIAIALPELGALHCTLDAGGAPVPWAVVLATPLDRSEFHLEPASALSTRSDAAGRASFDALDPGRWRVVAVSGDRRVRHEVVVAPGEVATESFELN